MLALSEESHYAFGIAGIDVSAFHFRPLVARLRPASIICFTTLKSQQRVTEFIELTKSSFSSGECCAESIVTAVLRSLGEEGQTAQRMAAGLCGGFGDKQGTCGALTGAIISLGLIPETELPKKQRKLASILRQRFEKRHNATVCKDLLKQKGFLQRRYMFCRDITEAAANDLQELLPFLAKEPEKV